MSDAVSIEWPKDDVQAMFRQIERAQKELGKTLGQAVRFAAWSVASSIGAKTTVAKKVRPYKVVSEGRGEARRKGGKKYAITSHRRGSKNVFHRRFESVRELKESPQARIGKAGLAKSSWFWGIKKIGGGRNIGQAGMTSTAKRRGSQVMDVESRLRGDDPFVRMTNTLPYAVDALRGGMGEVNSAMGSASRHMEKIIDSNIKKKMGAK